MKIITLTIIGLLVVGCTQVPNSQPTKSPVQVLIDSKTDLTNRINKVNLAVSKLPDGDPAKVELTKQLAKLNKELDKINSYIDLGLVLYEAVTPTTQP